jgi:hypothetical protein
MFGARGRFECLFYTIYFAQCGSTESETVVSPVTILGY